MRRGNVVSRICLCVCLSVFLSVCNWANFKKPWPRKFIFGTPVPLQNIQVKFLQQGHRVNVKVTGAKTCLCVLFER